MDLSLVLSALAVSSQLLAVILGAALLAGLFAGVVRTLTGMDEEILSIVLRTLAVFGVIYFLADPGWQYILDFTERVWDGSEVYFISK